MPRVDRLKVVSSAIAYFVPIVQAEGVRHHGDAKAPSHCALERNGLTIFLTGNALLLPSDSSTSAMLDIWEDGLGKVLSVSWQPSKPWLPPKIASFKSGRWMAGHGKPEAPIEGD